MKYYYFENQAESFLSGMEALPVMTITAIRRQPLQRPRRS